MYIFHTLVIRLRAALWVGALLEAYQISYHAYVVDLPLVDSAKVARHVNVIR